MTIRWSESRKNEGADERSAANRNLKRNIYHGGTEIAQKQQSRVKRAFQKESTKESRRHSARLI